MASRQIPERARTNMPHIAWNQIRGMRNRLVHDYPNVDIDIVWETVQHRIPELATQLRKLLTDGG